MRNVWAIKYGVIFSKIDHRSVTTEKYVRPSLGAPYIQPCVTSKFRLVNSLGIRLSIMFSNLVSLEQCSFIVTLRLI